MKKLFFLLALVPTIAFAIQKVPGTQVTIVNTNSETITLQEFADNLPSGSGFPLEDDADFNNHAATNISYIHLSGSTNELTSENGVLMYGGEEVGSGAGFPLDEDADFNNHGADNINYLQLKQYEGEDPGPSTIYYDGQNIMFGNNAIGSLNNIWGPANYSDQNTFITNQNAASLGILPDPTNANMRLRYDPENSVYYLQGFSAIPGPRGADGIANVLWAGTYYDGMILSNANTWVTWNGSIWTRDPSENPIHVEPGTQGDTNWVTVISRGNDGIQGANGKDGIGLHFIDWSTNLTVLSTNMLISYGGYLLMITNNVDIDNPGQPITERGVVNPAYKVVVRPGADGAPADVYTNMTFVIEFDAATQVNAHSLVVYKNYLWYAKQDYIPYTECPPPTEGPYWTCIGKEGKQGAAGLNGIGNLKYAGEWNQYRTNEVNDIVRYRRPEDGRYDWYRAIQGPFVGAQPDLSPNQWSKEITSGTDANVIEWTFVDGSYDYTREHINELYRSPSGKVYYSVGLVPAGQSYTPGLDTTGKWRLFVKDGTTITGNGIVWRGTYSESSDYVVGDMVTWSVNGAKSLYLCKVDSNMGIRPSNSDYWEAIATGLQGRDGQKGADGAVTHVYVTNITTQVSEHIDNITNTYNITNDSTSAILNFNDRDEIYHRVAFNDQHFIYNPLQETFSLTASALGVSKLNNLTGNVTIQGGDNVTVSKSGNIITIDSTGGLSSIPINVTDESTIDSLDASVISDAITFDGTAGFSLVTNENNQVIVTIDVGTASKSAAKKAISRGSTVIADLKYVGTWQPISYPTNCLVYYPPTFSLYYSVDDTDEELNPETDDSWIIFMEGKPGPAGSIQAAYATNLDYGLPATVELSGDPTNRIFTFGIPAGEPGPVGPPGVGLTPMGDWVETNTYLSNSIVRYGTNLYYTVAESTTGDNPTNGEPWIVFLNGGPQGIQGDVGPAGKISAVTAETLPSGSKARVTMGGTPENRTFVFSIPTGPVGERGPAGNIDRVFVESIEWDQDPYVQTAGTVENKSFKFFLPKGKPGEQGVDGKSSQISGVTVSTLQPGSDATVTISGESTNMVFNFGIPRGDNGSAPRVDNVTTTNLPAGESAFVRITPSADQTSYSYTFGLPAGQQGPAGQPGLNLIPMGQWSDSVPYEEGSLVRYVDGQYYTIADTTAGIAPTNTDYWQVFTLDGYGVATNATLIQYETTPYSGVLNLDTNTLTVVQTNNMSYLSVVGGPGGGGGLTAFELDGFGNIVPTETIIVGKSPWEVDENGDLIPVGEI